jgi:F-type H+-transporting ATPase subunit alpha
VADQVMIIFAGTRGHLDKVPVKEVLQWEKEFLTFMTDQKPEVRQKIVDTLDLDEGTSQALSASIVEFQQQYAEKHSKRETVKV